MSHRFDPDRSHRLDAPEREAWQKPDAVVDALDLRIGDCVVEVGSGTGYFTSRIARATGAKGRVIAVDAQERMLDALRARCEKEELDNVDLVAAPGENTTIQADTANLVFLANVAHEFDNLAAALSEATRMLRRDGRVAVLDWIDEKTEIGPPLDHRLSETDLRLAADAAGLRPMATHTFLPHHYYVVFVRTP
ncbi:MAG: hypothetical protein CME26_10120 [Gemmatimonadetes bacterium]|nr:hypothetical protein [Gemmatimonadota bacterium]|tara:strand:+ start:159 stop:737 length:579 start_codon:yes stop_codon:yes gene_type:complete